MTSNAVVGSSKLELKQITFRVNNEHNATVSTIKFITGGTVKITPTIKIKEIKLI